MEGSRSKAAQPPLKRLARYTGINSYLPGMEYADGVGLNLLPGPVYLTATIDYKS